MSSYHCSFRRYRGGIIAFVLVILCATLAAVSLGVRQPATTAHSATLVSNAPEQYEGMALLLRLYFKPLPKQMPGSESDTPDLIALGRKLYFEKGISLEKSQSCNTCHQLDAKMAGTDHEPTSKGVNGTMGTRNSPTVLNAGFQATQFWDGRAADLIEQAKGPLLNPVEMSMRSPEDVVNRLKSETDYADAFARAFPDQAEPITFDNVARAIAAFERTLITPSRFDRYLTGDKKALSPQEQRGLHRFVNTGCIQCHNSYPVGGRSLQKLGIFHAYKNREDLGRWNVTHLAEDKYYFKVPMLRNVTHTQPYFHDGKVPQLQEAVRQMAWMQLDTKLSPREVNEIVGFLHTLDAERPIVVAGP